MTASYLNLYGHLAIILYNHDCDVVGLLGAFSPCGYIGTQLFHQLTRALVGVGGGALSRSGASRLAARPARGGCVPP